jgi:L-idonate 5-dehydrogenase
MNGMRTATMHRFRLHGAHDLHLDQVERPDPGPGDVLVRVARVGICGSDKHYFHHGRCGAFVPRAPFALGHELAGTIAAVGTGVTDLVAGQDVTVDPLHACGICVACRDGHASRCPVKRYLGSAAAWPHLDGGLGEFLCVPADQIHRLPANVSLDVGALVEPAAVAWQAVQRAGDVAGATALVVGGGAIGQIILRILKALGAGPCLLVEPTAFNRSIGLQSGADDLLDPADAGTEGRLIAAAPSMAFECAGTAPALATCLTAVRAGGTIVQVGTLPDAVTVPLNRLMTKELTLRGSLQYHQAFPPVLALLAEGRLRLDDLITHRFPFAQTPAALEFALTARDAVKIQVEMP